MSTCDGPGHSAFLRQRLSEWRDWEHCERPVHSKGLRDELRRVKVSCLTVLAHGLVVGSLLPMHAHSSYLAAVSPQPGQSKLHILCLVLLAFVLVQKPHHRVDGQGVGVEVDVLVKDVVLDVLGWDGHC